MGANKNPYFNQSGYPDPTTYKAIKTASHDNNMPEERLTILIKALKNTINASDFELLNRIEARDLKSGKIFR